jgi:glutamine amidotransferase
LIVDGFMVSASKSVGVVDYGSGNLRSVCKALEAVGAGVGLVTKPEQLDTLDAVVVPGVGAFGDCAQNLRRCGLWEPLTEWLQAGRPYLGICLGYQLLFESSEESPGCKGLGVLPGRVVRFAGNGLKIPHIGWNQLQDLRGSIYVSMPASPYFYFVHSYFPVPGDERLVSARCDYGGTFAASISDGRLHATQFHPEKSQSAGLDLLRNFLDTLDESKFR